MPELPRQVPDMFGQSNETRQSQGWATKKYRHNGMEVYRGGRRAALELERGRGSMVVWAAWAKLASVWRIRLPLSSRATCV